MSIDIDQIINVARKDTRRIGGMAIQALCDEIERLQRQSARLQKERDDLTTQRDLARAWLRGELKEQAGDPTPKVWSCMWCGDMIHGGRDAAKEHVLQCRSNPLVKKLRDIAKEDTR